MKPSFRLFTLLTLGLFAIVAVFAAEQLYTCGMHPQIIKKEPGNCPICGMKLTPIRANTTGTSGERKVKFYKSTMNPGEVSPKPGKDSMGMEMVPVFDSDDSASTNIQIDAATIQRMNLRTGLVEHGPVRREFRTVGTVIYNEQGLRDITTKYEGWLEKLFVNTTWSVVKAGDPLFEIYSPDLYNAQLNYVVALRADGEGGGSLSRAALARLQLFDVPAEVIAELGKTKEPRRTIVFRAPTDGVVIEKMGVAGQMMKPGERIYRLADLSTVWVQAEIYEKDLPFVRNGDPAIVRTSYGPERTFAGKVDLLLPQVQEQTRTATARIVLDNADRFLRPGMFVDVRFATQLAADAVLVSDIAVLRSGERNTVFVALDGGFFEPRDVKLGARSEGNNYEVLGGLRAGERVVISGQFMLDSESQLREAIQKMLKPTNAGGESTPATAPASPKPVRSGAIVVPETFKALALVVADAGTALAQDDLAAYQKQLPVLQAALDAHFTADSHAAHGPLAPFKTGLRDHGDLAAARKDFAALGTVIADIVVSGKLALGTGLYVFECSMAKARWVQRDAGTKNPFYGASMLTCGDEIDGPGTKSKPTSSTGAPPLDARAMASKLPPGHPPIGGEMTSHDFLRRQMGMPTASGNDPGCGNCGMSAAAMAAGEPCEHDKK